MASVHIDEDCNEVIAHLPGVIASVAAKATEGAGKATAILATHRYTGAAHITVSHGSVDSFVNLVDPGGAAAAIEFGRMTGNRGTTRGVGAITGAF